MTDNRNRLLDTNDGIERALDAAGRYWRPEYYQMKVSQVAAERRDRAINAVEAELIWAEEDTLDTRDIASLIVDNSEFAFMGFDTLDTTPRTAFGRWLARWW